MGSSTPAPEWGQPVPGPVQDLDFHLAVTESDVDVAAEDDLLASQLLVIGRQPLVAGLGRDLLLLPG